MQSLSILIYNVKMKKTIKRKGRLNMKYSFIGLGNMASAIIAGMAASGKFKNDNIYGYNRSEGKTNTLRDRHGLIPCASALEAVEKAEVVVLCVKPQVMPKLLDEIAGAITKDKLVITIAAGKSCDWYEAKLGKGVPVVRVMPNINAKVKASVTAICGGKNAKDEHIKSPTAFSLPSARYIISSKSSFPHSAHSAAPRAHSCFCT